MSRIKVFFCLLDGNFYFDANQNIEKNEILILSIHEHVGKKIDFRPTSLQQKTNQMCFQDAHFVALFSLPILLYGEHLFQFFPPNF